jgi:hypothetical protein
MDLLDSISKLLERHSKSVPPDYAGFYSSISVILSSGVPPRKFCETFAAELKYYDDQMRRYSERGHIGEKLSQAEFDVFKEVFQKYKLLNGSAEKLPLAMRNLISELAGCPVMGLSS